MFISSSISQMKIVVGCFQKFKITPGKHTNTSGKRYKVLQTETREAQWMTWPLNALLPTHRLLHTHTQIHSECANWEILYAPGNPIALLVKSLAIRCTCIQFQLKEPAGSNATRRRRENITLVFRERRRDWEDDRQLRWMDIDQSNESAGRRICYN